MGAETRKARISPRICRQRRLAQAVQCPRIMSTVAVILILVVVLAVAAVAAWLWSERRAEAARASGAKLLAETERKTVVLIQQVDSLEGQLATAREERKQREAALDAAREEFSRREGELRERASAEKARVASLEERLNGIDIRDAESRQERETLRAELEAERAAQKETAAALSRAEADLAAQKQVIAQTKDIKTTFEAAAAEVLQKTGNKLSEAQFKQIETTLAPLKGSLGEFKKQVEEAERARQNEQGQLKEQLKNVLDSSAKLSEGAENLTRALKGDNKVAGGWGEFVLDRVLEETGLQKGREYVTQETSRTEDGKVLRPDVVVKLPEEKCLVIDSKVSLKHWEGFVIEEIEWTLVENSVRQHMKGLASKNYDDLHGAKSVDYVLMFLPIEPLFLELARRSPALLKEAWERRVMIVGPSTLQWALRSVSAIWKFEHQNKNAQEIARQAGAMHDRFVAFLKDMATIEKGLNQAQTAYSDAFKKLKTGRGNLIGSAQRLTALEAKTKKQLPPALVDELALDEPMRRLSSGGLPLEAGAKA